MNWTEVANFGVPMLILSGVGVAVWKFGWYMVRKIFGDETKGTKGLAGEWVAGEMDWRSKLTERLEKQTNACEGHIETVKALGDSLAQQIEAAKLARDAVTAAAAAAAESSESLQHIDDILAGRTDVITRTGEGVQQLKSCVFHVCDMCQALVAREFPGSAPEVSAYLLAIKKKVNDAA